MRHFTRVTPTMPASIQTAAYANTEILFDWHKVEGFKGGAITGIQVVIRGTNGADQAAATLVGMDLFFATSRIPTLADGVNVSVDTTPTTLGTTGAIANTPGWFNNLIAYVPIVAADMNDDDLIFVTIASKSGLSIPVSGDLYVAAISKGAFDFRSTVTCTGVQAITQSALVVGTTSALINFAPGDVLHDEGDRAIGTVKSVTDANNMVMTTNLLNATVNGKDLYNLSPIQLVLSSED